MMAMLPFMALVSDINDIASSDIQSVASSSVSRHKQVNRTKSDAMKFDRPGIYIHNNIKPFDTSVPVMDNSRNPMPFASRKEFVEQWLSAQSNAVHCGYLSDCSSSSFISNSPQSKRMLKSPLINCNRIKRFKSNNDKEKTLNSTRSQLKIGSPLQSKENVLAHENKERDEKLLNNLTPKRTGNVFSKNISIHGENQPPNKNHRISEAKLQRCRDAIFGSSKKAVNRSMTLATEKIIESTGHQSFVSRRITPYQTSVRQIVNEVEGQSSDITDVESLAPSSPMFELVDNNIEFDSPRKLDIQSLPSSPQVTNVHTDSESGEISDLDPDLVDYNSDKDETIINAPDNVDGDLSISIQNSECDVVSLVSEKCRIISPINSSDSDQTFFSENEDILNATRIDHENEVELSQKISQNSVSNQNSDMKTQSIELIDICSGNSLPMRLSKTETLDNCPVIAKPVVKKKKKVKKGSLVGRLQNLITGQASFLRIWRHRMVNTSPGTNNKQCITLKIINCALQYNRQFFTGLVIGDTHKLLDRINDNNHRHRPDELNRTDSSSSRTVTVLTAPEIVGTININDRNLLEIYPPWEVIDADKIILSVLYFRVVIDDNSMACDNYAEKNNEIIKKFDCPCLTAKQLVESCKIKFDDVKPNITRYLFDD